MSNIQYLLDENYGYNRLAVDDELGLLASWVCGENREDISLFEPAFFEHKELFKGLRDGKKWGEITADADNKYLRDGLGMAQLMLLRPSYIDYLQIRYNAIILQRSCYAEELKRADEDKYKKLTDKIEALNCVIYERENKPKATDLANLYLGELQERLEEQQPQYGKGFKYLDVYTGGIHRGQLVTLGARPGVGKSAFALQVAFNVADQGYKVLYLPLEMTTTETLERLLLQQQVVDSKSLEEPTEKNIKDIKDFLTYLEQDNELIIYEGLNRIEDIKKKIKEHSPYLVVIDQLTQVSTGEKARDNRERYIAVTRELKRMAMDNKVAILLLSQLNRDSKNKDSAPGIENLHESDSTGQDSDTVFCLYTKDDSQAIHEEYRETSLYIAKQRNGVSGKEIPLMFNGDKVRFDAVDIKASTPGKLNPTVML